MPPYYVPPPPSLGPMLVHTYVFGKSEYAGQTLPVAYGDGIFLDVRWLSTALKPILSHKLEWDTFPQHLCGMRDEFVENGVLRVELAEELWCREMGGPLGREGVVEALCRVLLDLGVALPLDSASLLARGERKAGEEEDHRKRKVVAKLRSIYLGLKSCAPCGVGWRSKAWCSAVLRS